MKSMEEMIQAAQQAAETIQKQMNETQAKLDGMEVEGVSGGGLVKIRASAKGRIIGVAIDDSLMQVSEKQMLEDLLSARIRERHGSAPLTMGGPREAMWHAIIRRNHGVTHFIVGRDHAGPGKNSQGKDFYSPYDAQELVAKHAAEIGIEVVPFKQMVYVQEKAQYFPVDEVPEGATVLDISGTELRRRLREGLEIPDWFSFPEVVQELRRTSPARSKQGFTVFFTGLSGSGKSTIANALMVKLMEMGGRPVTLLDGDVVRKHLSSELGFSKEHRDLNIKRIGYVASEITKNGGIAICAPIAPYTATRRAVREMVESFGAFVETHVATSLEECERRDRKGLYKLAREGKIKEFTGISDPYEAPTKAELVVDTENVDVDHCAHQVLLKLEQMGLIRA